jgi:hypothetical protein
MSVYLNGSSVLLDSGSVATSSGCCCGCNTCDDLPPTNPFGPPVHINIQLTLSGTCDTLTLSGTVTYDSDLSFALDGGLNYCAHNIGGGPPWSGHWTATCTLDGSTLDFGGGGAVAGLLRPVSDCTWWMFVSGFNESVNDNLTKNLKPCSGCGKNLSDTAYDQFWQPKDKKKMEYVITQQVAVTAESVPEALAKAEPKDGTVITANVVPRPKPQPTIKTGSPNSPVNDSRPVQFHHDAGMQVPRFWSYHASNDWRFRGRLILRDTPCKPKSGCNPETP